ncbi:GNAT family N-acetyltransferase [Streptomyces sp. NPDC005408]|uniref:GNAT family N-acetyltransferase n=1 Tax=Streptomyces sp. NPDC005408 TaxID=3155341 RepID=UPI0033B1800A
MTKLIDAPGDRPGKLSTLPAPVTVDILENRAARDFLTSQWPGLYEQDRLATPYQSPAWLTVHADQLPATAVLLVLVAAAPSGPRAALAVVRDRSIGGRTEVQPLSAPTAEYIRLVGPDAEEPHVAAAIAHTLATLGADVMMPDVPSNSALGRHVAAQWQHTITRCARIDLPVPYAAMSRATRREHKRRKRAWDQLTTSSRTVAYHRTSSAAELLAAYPALCHLHRLRWSSPRPDHRLTPADEQFRAVLQHCSSMAFIATLAVDESVVAAQLCLHRGRYVYSLLPAMDPAQQELAPGHALLRTLTDDLTAAGFNTLDLGRTTCSPGQLAYKAQYAPVWTTTLTAARRTC